MIDRYGVEMRKPGLICQRQVKGKWEQVCPWFFTTPEGEPECYLGGFNHQGTSKTHVNILQYEEKDHPRVRRCLFERADVEKMLHPRYQNPVAGLQTTFQESLTITKKVKGKDIEVTENEFLDSIQQPVLGMRPMIAWLLVHRIKRFTPLARKKGKGIVKAPFALPGGWTRSKLWRQVTDKETEPEVIAKNIIRDQTKQTSMAIPINKKEMGRRMQVWTDWGIMVRSHVLKRVQEASDIVLKLNRIKRKKIIKLQKRVESKFRTYIYCPSILKTFFGSYSEIMDVKKGIEKAENKLKFSGYYSVISEIATLNSSARHAWRKAILAYKFIMRTKRKPGQVPTIDELMKMEAVKKNYIAVNKKWRNMPYTKIASTFKLVKGDIVWASKFTDTDKIIIMNVYNDKLEYRRERVKVAYGVAAQAFEKQHGFQPMIIRDSGEIRKFTDIKDTDSSGAYRRYMESMSTGTVFNIWTSMQESPDNYDKKYKEYIKNRVLAILGDTKAQIKAEKSLEILMYNQQLKNWEAKRDATNAEIDGLTKSAQIIRKKIREGKKKLQQVRVVQEEINEKKQKQLALRTVRVRLRKLMKKTRTKAGKKKLKAKIVLSMKTHNIIEKKVTKLSSAIKDIPSIIHLEEELMRIEKGYSRLALEKGPSTYTGATPPTAPEGERLPLTSSAGLVQLREHVRDIEENIIPSLRQRTKEASESLERINTLVTAPHAMATNPAKEHLTDWAAPELATKISNLLKG